MRIFNLAVVGFNFITSSAESEKVLAEFNLWDPKAFKLTDDTFEKTIATGDWIIFFGSKWCVHCQAFTPDWVKLQDIVAEKYKKVVQIAKVECTVSPNLCKNVIAYPTINIYRSSAFVKEIEAYDIASIQGIADKIYAERTGTKKDSAKYVLAQYLEDRAKQVSTWNVEGKVIHLTQDDFKQQTAGKAWLLMFHAPVTNFN